MWRPKIKIFDDKPTHAFGVELEPRRRSRLRTALYVLIGFTVFITAVGMAAGVEAVVIAMRIAFMALIGTAIWGAAGLIRRAMGRRRGAGHGGGSAAHDRTGALR